MRVAHAPTAPAVAERARSRSPGERRLGRGLSGRMNSSPFAFPNYASIAATSFGETFSALTGECRCCHRALPTKHRVVAPGAPGVRLRGLPTLSRGWRRLLYAPRRLQASIRQKAHRHRVTCLCNHPTFGVGRDDVAETECGCERDEADVLGTEMDALLPALQGRRSSWLSWARGRPALCADLRRVRLAAVPGLETRCKVWLCSTPRPEALMSAAVIYTSSSVAWNPERSDC